jgi:predicted DNA-binding transcriptional regulator YafY
MYSAQLSRCLQLLTIMQSRIGHGPAYLAREFEVSKRTIYRDLCLLKQAGVPLAYDPEKCGYSLHFHTPFHIKLSPISDDELAAMMLAAHIFSLSCVGELNHLIGQAIRKLLLQVPANLREEVANLLNSVSSDPLPVPCPTGSQRVIYELFAAIRQKRPIRIVYDSENEPIRPIRTKVTPRQLAAIDGSWHLIGRSSWHRKVYRFDLQHILIAEQVKDAYNSVETAGYDTEHPDWPGRAEKPRSLLARR